MDDYCPEKPPSEGGENVNQEEQMNDFSTVEVSGD